MGMTGFQHGSVWERSWEIWEARDVVGAPGLAAEAGVATYTGGVTEIHNRGGDPQAVVHGLVQMQQEDGHLNADTHTE
jgi:hypothetical protein